MEKAKKKKTNNAFLERFALDNVYSTG